MSERTDLPEMGILPDADKVARHLLGCAPERCLSVCPVGGVWVQHHPACPGLLRHRLVAVRSEDYWDVECTVCGWLPSWKLYDTALDALRDARGHEHDEPCPGGKCIALIGGTT